MTRVDKKFLGLATVLFFIISNVNCMDNENLSEIDYATHYPLHYQIGIANQAIIESLLKKEKNGIDQRDNAGQTLLFKAVLLENEKTVSLLLKKHAKVNIVDNAGATPLDYAINYRNKDIINMLIKKKAKPNLLCKHGWTPTHTAAAIGGNNLDILQIMFDNGGDPLSLALARSYSPDEWIDEMAERWFKGVPYAKEFLKLERNKKKDNFYSCTRNMEGNRQEARDDLLRRFGQLQQQKKFDIFQCCLVFYNWLFSLDVSLGWPGTKKYSNEAINFNESGVEKEYEYEKYYTAWQFCKKIENILCAKINFFSEGSSYDFSALLNWADQLLDLLDTNENLPEIPGVDWHDLKQWLKENKKEFIRGKLLDQAAISWDKIFLWHIKIRAYLDEIQRWDFPSASCKINDQAYMKWGKVLTEVLVEQKLNHQLQTPKDSWSVPKIKAWIDRVKIATRESSCGEYLVVPCLDFESESAFEAVKFLRQLIADRLVDGILILPLQSKKVVPDWVQDVEPNFIHFSQNEQEDSCLPAFQDFMIISSDHQLGLSDEQWLESLKFKKEEILQNGFLLTDKVNEKKMAQMLELIRKECATYECNMLVIKDTFSGSLMNESTRAILKEIGMNYDIQEVVIDDQYGHHFKTNRLLVAGDAGLIYKWFECLQQRISENKKIVKNVDDAFTERMKNENIQDKILQLLQQDIPLKIETTFAHVFLEIFAKTYTDIDPIFTKLSVQDWADKMYTAIKEQMGLDLKHLIYYLLAEDGYQLRVSGIHEDSLINWSALITKLDDSMMHPNIKKFLNRQAQLHSFKNHDGYTPLDLSTQSYYKAILLDQYVNTGLKALGKGKKSGRKELLKCVKLQNFPKILQKLKEYKLEDQELLIIYDKAKESDISFSREAMQLTRSNRGGGSDDSLQKNSQEARLTTSNRGGGSDSDLQSRSKKTNSLLTSSWHFAQKKSPKLHRKAKK